MPRAAPTPCRHHGCGNLVFAGGGYCTNHKASHKALDRREDDARRGSARKRGYTVEWEKARDAFLRVHPLCMCEECDEGRLRLTAASVVDHKIPHRGDVRLFWDQSNWQSMAKSCHDKKTAHENGGFGNRPRGASVGVGG